MATIRIRAASSHDPKSVWVLPKLSDINTKLNSATDLPKNAQITGAKVIINADYDGGTALSKVYIKCGLGYTGTLNETLLGETRITQSAADYSATIDLKYFSSLVSDFAFNTANYGSYLAINIYTENNLVSKFNLNYVDLEITYTIPTYTITWANIDGNGKTTTTTVNRGTVPTYSGTPTKASTAQYTYAFSGWSPSPVAATGNATYTAQFTATTRSYTLTVTAGTGGNVSGGGTYEYGKSATLTATPNTGYKFKYWQDNTSLTDATRTVTVTGNATYTAVFEKLTYTISTAVTPSGSGIVEGGGTYNHGDRVSLLAAANEGYEFVKWSDGWDIDHRLITVTESATYTAIFEKILPPEITSVQMLYSNKQISAANKVPAGEFFRIVVGAVAYDI